MMPEFWRTASPSQLSFLWGSSLLLLNWLDAGKKTSPEKKTMVIIQIARTWKQELNIVALQLWNTATNALSNCRAVTGTQVTDQVVWATWEGKWRPAKAPRNASKCKYAVINHKMELTAISKQQNMASLISEFPSKGKTLYSRKFSRG